MGFNTTASGYNSTTIGDGTIAASTSPLSIGRYNDASTTEDNTLFVTGNGSNNASRSDALLLDRNGNLTIAGTLTESSDRGLKKDIKPLKEGALEKLGMIHPVRYRFKEAMGHPSGKQIGLIAQEIREQFPELVSEQVTGT